VTNLDYSVRCFRCGELASTRKEGPSADAVGQHRRWEAMPLDVLTKDGCRAAVCCWPCFWEIDPDMWINPEDWSRTGPLVPLEKLPVLDHEDPKCWDPSHYAWPLEGES